MILVIDALMIFLLNLPFGYWRKNVKKFSLQWALAIHLPVPVVILIRIYSGLGFQLYTYPILVGAFFLGQFIGSKIYKYGEENFKVPITSCLMCDMFKSFKTNEGEEI